MPARYLETITVPYEMLVPFDGNPNQGDVGAVRTSVRRNGQYRSVIARRLDDGTLQLLAGHTTSQATALEAGGDVRVEVIDADDRTARRIVAADNSIARRASMDDGALLALLDKAEADGGLDGTGYDESEYRELIDKAMASDRASRYDSDGGSAAADDTDPAPPPVPYSHLGDLWVLGDHRLVVGDARDDTAWAALLEGERVDAVWTDPPYGVAIVGGNHALPSEERLRRGGKTIDNDALDHEGMIAFLTGLFGSAARNCRPGGAWYVSAPSGQYAEPFHRVLMGLGVLRHTIIWVKDTFVLGRGDYHSRHELVLYGWKPGAAHHPLQDRTQDDVWEIARPRRSKDHPTMKPVELVTRCLTNSTDPGALIADPCSGSGTTVLACEITGRRGRAIEFDPAYADVTARRWQELTGQLPYNARTGDPVDLIGRQ